MRTSIRTYVAPLVLGVLAFLPTIGSPSETRVDATGGLTTILTDETDDLNLFLDGNPAGLALLNTRDRLDISGQWSYSGQEGPWGSSQQQTFTTIPRPSDIPIKYEGLMVFPDSHWAFQVLGDFLSLQGVPTTPNAGDTSTSTQYRTLVRGAYACSLGAIGVEILDTENDAKYDPGLFWTNNAYPYVGINSGSSGQNQLLVKSGLIATFPANPSSDEPRWQIGGHWTLQPAGSIQNENYNLYYLNSSPFSLNNVVTTTDYLSWGAEIYYELPSVAKVRFSVTLSDWDTDFSQTVPYSSALFSSTPNPYHNFQFGSMDTQGAFKLCLPFSGDENLKIGGSLDGYFYNSDLLRATGNVYDNEDRQQIGTRFGIGLESPKEYTMGIQWKSLSQINGNNAINNPGTSSNVTSNNYDYYQLAFGGEKWLSATWAFRMGLVLEQDVYSPHSTNTLNTSLNAGVGLEQVFGRADFRILLGQTSDFNNSSNTIGLIGVQLSATVFL